MPKHDEQGHAKWLDQYLRTHSGPTGSPSGDLWRQGMLDFSQLDVDASVLWISIGPAPLVIDAEQVWQGTGPNSGEVTDIAIDPVGDSDNTIYIATNDGGIWKTDDGGGHWSQSMDDLLSFSMGAVALDNFSPAMQRVVYAGTGNMYDGGRFFNKGVGIYRSPDGGSTWSIVDGGPFATVFAGLSINDIEVIAADTVLVATNQGLFRSVDGGQNFGSNDPAFDNRQPVTPGLITCIVPDAANPANIVYAGVATVGLLKSSDGGKTFPTNLLGPSNPQLGAAFGNIQIAQSEMNPQVLYAIIQYTPPATPNAQVVRGLFQSMDGGTNWTVYANIAVVAGADGFSQTHYDMTVGVDPQVAVAANPNPPTGLIYVAFQQMRRSNNGGVNFEVNGCTSGQAHWDEHVQVFSPPAHRPASKPTGIYIGTDGGIAKSADGGATWQPINGEIGSNLFRGIDIGRGSPANNAYTYGGMQDTGTAGHRPGDSATEWHAGIDGDGYVVAVDPTDPTIVYGFDDWAFIKTTNAGAHWDASDDSPAVVGAGLPNPHTDLTRAVAVDQVGADTAHRTVYVGVIQDLYKSTDAGLTFGVSILSVGGDIRCIATTKADVNRVWVGADDGTVHYSANGGITWDQGSFQTKPGPAFAATGIAIDPDTPDRVAVVFAGSSGIHSKFRTQRVYLTTDSGVTWNDVSGTDGNGPIGNLPDLPMHAVAFDKTVTPAALIVASDAGVLRSTDITITGGNVTATWKLYGVGLPTVCCNSLAIDNTANPPVLRVGTYGRSCFEIFKPSGGARLYCSPAPGFGAVPIGGGKGTLPVYLYNCGDAQLSITGIDIISSPNFAFNPAPAFPIAIDPGKSQTLSLLFTPAAAGEDAALLNINSNDASSPFVLNASGRGVAKGKARIAVNPVNATGFGSASADRSAVVQIFNVGTDDLVIDDIKHVGSSDFSLDPVPTFKLTIAAGAESDLTIQYHPTSNGDANATFQIESNDAATPYTYSVSGTGVNVSSSNWLTILEYVGIGLLAAGAVVGGVVLAEKLSQKKGS
jgi:photosystem II stability/assembly factor-like uncharacterized protein